MMMLLYYLIIFGFLCGWSRSEPSDDARDEILCGIVSDSDTLTGTTLSTYETWAFSLLASCIIGFSGIVPIIFIPLEMSSSLGEEKGGKLLRLLLSFAVGGLLGDVFLHLLPEAWNYQKNLNSEFSSSLTALGLWVLLGMFSFVVLEIMFTASKSNEPNTSPPTITNAVHCNSDKNHLTNCSSNGHVLTNEMDTAYHQKSLVQNGHVNTEHKKSNVQKSSKDIHIAGYLNLMANSIDNFSHGLAVAASFIVGCKMGVVTTFAILIHEIPHEIGDFAILLKSGFHPWTAAKAQISTATIGILGVIVALSAESIDKVGICTSWILPFTAGGFLNIALVNVLPDLLNEKDAWESVKQLICILTGIGVMAMVSILI